MQEFTRKIQSAKDEDAEYYFECYDNTEPIEIGDYFIFFFMGIADVGQCLSETEKEEINHNDRIHNDDLVLDLVTGFWMKCYKIKTTSFDYKDLDY